MTKNANVPITQGRAQEAAAKKSFGRKIQGFWRNLTSFKKISATVAFVGVTIGVVLGINNILKEVSKYKESKRAVAAQLSIGDQFINRSEYERAIEEYEKALSLDKNNPQVLHRIIRAQRKKYQVTYSVERKKVDDTLALIYRLQTVDPSMKDDAAWLIEEAFLLKVDGRLKDSMTVFEKANKVSPNTSHILAEIGYLRALTSSRQKVEGIDLIQTATKLEPENPRYHYYLAQSAKMAGLEAVAIREFYQTAKLASGGDTWSKGVQKRGFEEIYAIFDDRGLSGAISSDLDMPLEERAEILQYSIENIAPAFRSPEKDVYLSLARIYLQLGDTVKATDAIRAGLPRDKGAWRGYGYLLETYAAILEKSNLDPDTLKEVHAILEGGTASTSTGSVKAHPDDFFIGQYLK